MDWDDVEHTIELPGVYDGWSVAVMNDGTRINRWEDQENPGHPAAGYETRYQRTLEYLNAA